MHIDKSLQSELEILINNFLIGEIIAGSVIKLDNYSNDFEHESILIVKFIVSYLNTLLVIDNENLVNAIDKGICSELNKNDFKTSGEVLINLRILIYFKLNYLVAK